MGMRGGWKPKTVPVGTFWVGVGKTWAYCGEKVKTQLAIRGRPNSQFVDRRSLLEHELGAWPTDRHHQEPRSLQVSKYVLAALLLFAGIYLWTQRWGRARALPTRGLPTAIDVSSSHGEIAVADSEGTVKTATLELREKVYRSLSRTPIVRCAYWDDNNVIAFVAEDEGKLIIVNRQDLSVADEIALSPIAADAFTSRCELGPKNTVVFSPTSGDTIYFAKWNGVGHWKVSKLLEGAMKAAAWSPDGKTLCVAHGEGTVGIWESSGPEPMLACKGKIGGAGVDTSSVAVCVDSDQVICVMGFSGVTYVATRTNELNFAKCGEMGLRVTRIQFLNDKMIVGGGVGKLQLFDLGRGTNARGYSAHGGGFAIMEGDRLICGRPVGLDSGVWVRPIDGDR